MLNGWAGRTEHRCMVIGETPKRYRIRVLQPTRLPSRRLADPQTPVMVPRDAVRLDPPRKNCDSPNCPAHGDGPCAACEGRF